MIVKVCAAINGAILGFGGIVAVRHGIFTKVCTLAEECELPEGKYKVVYTR